MLKVFLGFMVSVVVLLSSVYVPLGYSRAYATSASVLITRIQAGGVGAATQEFIVLYNNSADEVDITGWCLTNKSSAHFVCFTTPLTGQALYLPGHAYAVVASDSLAISLPTGMVTATYVPTSQSSGSITGSSDSVSLLDASGVVIDRQSWTTALSSGMQLERRGTGDPALYDDTDSATDWSVTASRVLPYDETELDAAIVDICPNIDGIQAVIPFGKEKNSDGDCVEKYVVMLTITEVLPNAVGTDIGQEFIEIYNPNANPVDLSFYELRIGPQLENTYDFPSGSVIASSSYVHFSNAAIPFTLLNSSSIVALVHKSGVVVSQAPAYLDPKDGESWAVIDGVWQYTATPTPGEVNIPSRDDEPVLIMESILQPCASNQYRSPETNRCRLLSTASTISTPCKDNQYRSEETNRCRNIASELKTVTPCDVGEERNLETNRCRKVVVAAVATACKEGQERNPDTNRCRTVTKMPSADYGVLGAQTKASGNWYVLAAVGGVLILALGYAIWEWHSEIGKFFRNRYGELLRFARVRK